MKNVALSENSLQLNCHYGMSCNRRRHLVVCLLCITVCSAVRIIIRLLLRMFLHLSDDGKNTGSKESKSNCDLDTASVRDLFKDFLPVSQVYFFLSK